MELNIMFCLHLVENSVTDKHVRFAVQEDEKKKLLAFGKGP